MLQENNHQATNKLLLAGRKETTTKNLKTFYYDPTYYHNANKVFKSHIRCKFWHKTRILTSFHLQQIGFGRTNQNYQEFFNTLCTSRTSVTKEAAESGRRKTLNKPVIQINMTGVAVFQFWFYVDYKS